MALVSRMQELTPHIVHEGEHFAAKGNVWSGTTPLRKGQNTLLSGKRGACQWAHKRMGCCKLDQNLFQPDRRTDFISE